jgi:hypothetical protein
MIEVVNTEKICTKVEDHQQISTSTNQHISLKLDLPGNSAYAQTLSRAI